MPKKLPREYSAAELAVFAAHRADRAQFRPRQCKRQGMCWVELGPPAYRVTPEDSYGSCAECEASPAVAGRIYRAT